MSKKSTGAVRESEMQGEVTNEFDWNDVESVSMTVVETVAAVTGKRPTELDPLNHVVDTDAIETLFRPTSTSPRNAGRLEFTYEGCVVTIKSAGLVEVRPAGHQDF